MVFLYQSVYVLNYHVVDWKLVGYKLVKRSSICKCTRVFVLTIVKLTSKVHGQQVVCARVRIVWLVLVCMCVCVCVCMNHCVHEFSDVRLCEYMVKLSLGTANH